MRKVIVLLIILILSLLVMTGCKKEASDEPSPPSPPGMDQDSIGDILSEGEGVLQKPKALYINDINL